MRGPQVRICGSSLCCSKRMRIFIAPVDDKKWRRFRSLPRRVIRILASQGESLSVQQIHGGMDGHGVERFGSIASAASASVAALLRLSSSSAIRALQFVGFVELGIDLQRLIRGSNRLAGRVVGGTRAIPSRAGMFFGSSSRLPRTASRPPRDSTARRRTRPSEPGTRRYPDAA